MRKPFHKNSTAKIFQNAIECRQRETAAEDELWMYLKGRRLSGLKFRRQHPILSYIIDFYCHELKLGIEIDGSIHSLPDQREYDKNRTLHLTEHGIKIIRFTNEEVLNNITQVLRKITDHSTPQ